MTKRFDVIIVGAGIVGVSLAYELRHLGGRVLLIDAREPVSAVTGYTTGKLSCQHDLIYSHLVRHRGIDKAKHYFHAQLWGLERVHQLAAELEIDCDLTDASSIIYSQSERSDEKMQAELDAYRQIGISGELLDDQTSPFSMRRKLVMHGQAHFNPRKYLFGLLSAASDAGVQIASRLPVSKIHEESGECRLETEQGDLHCGFAVSASHYPSHDSALFVAKLNPQRSYACAFAVDEFPDEGMFIAQEDEEFHSWRPAFDREQKVLIIGGSHHKVGEKPKERNPYEAIEQWGRANFNLGSQAANWSTQDLWTADGVPYIGESPGRDRIALAAGFGGWGMTTGIAAAKIISDKIAGIDNPWTDVFSPSRLPLESIPELIRQNAGTVGHLVGDKIRGADKVDLNSLAPGEGELGELDGHKRAVYKDESGEVCVLNPSCTHMGCQIAWNELESSWDCPCHGSRFDRYGNVLNGPAVAPLEKIG